MDSGEAAKAVKAAQPAKAKADGESTQVATAPQTNKQAGADEKQLASMNAAKEEGLAYIRTLQDKGARDSEIRQHIEREREQIRLNREASESPIPDKLQKSHPEGTHPLSAKTASHLPNDTPIAITAPWNNPAIVTTEDQRRTEKTVATLPETAPKAVTIAAPWDNPTIVTTRDKQRAEKTVAKLPEGAQKAVTIAAPWDNPAAQSVKKKSNDPEPEKSDDPNPKVAEAKKQASPKKKEGSDTEPGKSDDPNPKVAEAKKQAPPEKKGESDTKPKEGDAPKLKVADVQENDPKSPTSVPDKKPAAASKTELS